MSYLGSKIGSAAAARVFGAFAVRASERRYENGCGSRLNFEPRIDSKELEEQIRFIFPVFVKLTEEGARAETPDFGSNHSVSQSVSGRKEGRMEAAKIMSLRFFHGFLCLPMLLKADPPSPPPPPHAFFPSFCLLAPSFPPTP